MNPVKRMSALFLTLCCVLTLITSTYASGIEPTADATDNFRAILSISLFGQASCSVTGKASMISHKIEVTMSLYQLSNPIPLKSWSASDTGTLIISKNYYVSKGHDYQVTATITIKDSGGGFIESFTINSPVVHY